MKVCTSCLCTSGETNSVSLYPSVVVTDNGAEFVNSSLKQMFRQRHVQHVTTELYHQQSNARNERMYCTLTDILSKHVQETPQIWGVFLPMAVGAIHMNVNESTVSLFLYGRHPWLP